MDTSAPGAGDLVFRAFRVFLSDGDLLPEELGCFASCMRNERFCLRAFSREFLTPERPALLFACFGFFLWSSETYTKILGVPPVREPSVVGILGVVGWKVLRWFPQALGSLRLPFLEPPLCPAHPLQIFLVALSFPTSGVLGDEHVLDERVSVVEQKIPENGTESSRSGAHLLISR